MKHVSILIPRGHVSMVNVEGCFQVLNWVNEHLDARGEPRAYDVHLVAAENTVPISHGFFTVHADQLLEDVKKTDLVIIPAIFGDFNKNLENNREMKDWVTRRYNEGAEVVSLCVGAFFLAATGLLDGRSCSTHWDLAEYFRQSFPKARVESEKIVTECDGLYTSGGAYSFTNLLIYLIERHVDRQAAIATAKAFMIDLDRMSQSPFMVFSGQKTHGDELILSIQEYLEQNYEEKVTVEDLADRFAIGRRTLERRFKKATANTPVEYLQRVKIEAAKQRIESGHKTINEVMYEVGYQDVKAFREVFRKLTGLSPYDYKSKYVVKSA